MTTTDAPTTPPATPEGKPAAGQDPASTEAAGVATTSQGQSPNGEPPGTDAGESSEPVDPAELQRRLTAAEASRDRAAGDAQKYRRQLREREAEERRQEAEGQTVEQRQAAFTADREAFEQERTQFRLERAMARIGTELNLVDSDAALWLLDWEKIDFDDDGNPTNLKALTEDLIRQKDYLVKKEATPPAAPVAPTIGAASGAAVAGPPPVLTAQELDYIKQTPGMTPERYAALKDVKTLQDYQKITPGPQQQQPQPPRQ
jgi:hypothetical protein